MKAVVDQDICIGCALCVSMCDTVFSMNDNGMSEAITEDIAEEYVADTEEACQSCPVNAIELN